MMIKGLYNQP